MGNFMDDHTRTYGEYSVKAMNSENINNTPESVISIDRFDDNPGPYCMSFGFEIGYLSESIEKIGLINKPLIYKGREGRLEIVAGYRRILALKALEWREIPCTDISDSGISSLDMLLLNLYDNYSVRKFNNIEKAMILNRLSFHLPRETIIKNYSRIVGISNIKEIDMLMKTEDLAPEIKTLIADDTLSLKLIESISGMDHSFLTLMVKWISDLKLNYNQQIQFAEYITEISSIEKISVSALLGEDQYMTLLRNDHMNTPQNAKKFMTILRTRRFPVLTEMEERFKSRIEKLNLPREARIKHHPFFEAEGYILEMDFKEGGDLITALRKLSDMDGLEEIGDPWEKERIYENK
jgi:hypothetical protein